jgi:hypothetical protein
MVIVLFVLATTHRMTELLIFYCINSSYGESWTPYSYLQIAGLAGLLYGTAIYNAPNGGSLQLEGQWWAFGINLSREYAEVILRENKAEKAGGVGAEEAEEVGEYHRID